MAFSFYLNSTYFEVYSTIKKYFYALIFGIFLKKSVKKGF